MQFYELFDLTRKKFSLYQCTNVGGNSFKIIAQPLARTEIVPTTKNVFNLLSTTDIYILRFLFLFIFVNLVEESSMC